MVQCEGMYLPLKGVDKGKTFHAGTTRACGYLIDVCGENCKERVYAYTRVISVVLEEKDTLI